MKTDSLQIKDYINIGLFTALYFITMFMTGVVIKLIPVLIIVMPAIIGSVCGIIYMLFVTKVKKRGMILIMAIILGGLMSLISGIWLILITSLISGVTAEIVSGMGKYKKSNYLIAGYSFFNCWSLGAMLTIWIYRDWFLRKMEATGGASYAEIIKRFTPNWMIYFVILGALFGGLFGGIIGRKVLHKHFIKEIGRAHV